MRITTLLIVFAATATRLLSAAPVHAQDIREKQITMELHNATLGNALDQIEKLSGFRLGYPVQQVARWKGISLDRERRSVERTLALVLANTDLDFRQQKNVIVIFRKQLPDIEKQAADTVVTGYITDEHDTPIPGVTVRSKSDRSASTATDENGHFHLNVGKGDVLILSYIGYATKEVTVGGTANFHISMSPVAGSLNEVVVIGYGTSVRKELTGSVASVKSKTIQEQPVGNVLNALQGRMAGVQVTQSNGLPGSGVKIQIRGQTSLNAPSVGTEPLYIVDGVPYNFSLGVYSTAGNGTVNPFNSLNPADIESIDVLKDADATAIYGARGGNGVILITTKKGKAGKTRLDINVNTGVAKVGNYIEMLNGEQYLQLRKEAFANDNVTPTVTNAPDLVSWDQTKFRDWQKELMGGTAHYSDAQASLSGGNENTHFSLGAGYHHESTVLPGSFAEDRMSGRLNVEHTSLDKKFYALFSTSYSYDKNNPPGTDVSSYYYLPPNYDPYTSTGGFNYIRGLDNPYALLSQKYNTTSVNFAANASLRYTLLPGLYLKANLGYTTLNFDQNKQIRGSSVNPYSGTQVSNAVFGATTARSYIMEPQVEYVKDIFGGKLNALLGTTFQQNNSNTNTVNGTNYSNDALLGSMAAAGTLSSIVSVDKYKFTSVFGRLTYNWEGKYIVNGTLRRDGSSRFGANNRFGTFGAVGAAWVFTQEDFVKGALPFLSFGKLRGSYGITGNDQIPNYQYLSTYATGSSASAYQGTAIQFPARLANPNIRWESNRKLEAALDLGFIKDRILFTAAVYQNRSGDQLLYINTPGQVGFSSYMGNFPATIQNRGLELELNTTNIQRRDFQWTTSFNFTLAQTKLVRFDNLANLSFYTNQYLVGYPVPLTQSYVFTGIDPKTGIITYKTANGGLPNYSTDRVPVKTGTPYYGGLSNNFTYKQFELGFFFQFSHRYGYTNSVNGTLGSLNNQNITTLDRWRKEGDVTQFGAATTTAGTPAYNAYSFYYNSSTAFWGNASWLKLRNVNLAYNVPKAWLSRAKISNLKVYAQGQNLFAISKYKNAYDPETGASMPALRTIVFGLNASF